MYQVDLPPFQNSSIISTYCLLPTVCRYIDIYIYILSFARVLQIKVAPEYTENQF